MNEWPEATFEFDAAPWRIHAACKGEPTRLWFPERGEPTARAKRICATCPVQQECLEYSLNIPNLVGIWGGKSGSERRELRAIKAFNKPIKHGTAGGYAQHIKRDETPCDECRRANSQAAMARRKKQ